jgi:hypothetical protein
LVVEDQAKALIFGNKFLHFRSGSDACGSIGKHALRDIRVQYPVSTEATADTKQRAVG